MSKIGYIDISEDEAWLARDGNELFQCSVCLDIHEKANSVEVDIGYGRVYYFCDEECVAEGEKRYLDVTISIWDKLKWWFRIPAPVYNAHVCSSCEKVSQSILECRNIQRADCPKCGASWSRPI